MPQEPPPAKKVVKRVVRKTVAPRPVVQPPAPEVRHGRKVTARPRPLVPPKRTPVPGPPLARPAIPKPAIEFGRRAGAVARAVGRRSGHAVAAVAGGIKRAAHAVADSAARRYGAARAYRLPRMGPTKAAALAGALVGVATVLTVTLLLMAFSALRGVATGGGRWGSPAFVLVAVLAFALGAYLLARLQVHQPRVTSFLGLCLTLVVVMAVFLGPISGAWAWLILPALEALAFALSHRLVAMAAAAPRAV